MRHLCQHSMKLNEAFSGIAGDDNVVSSDDESSAAGRPENKSLLGGMFSFMTKRHSSGGGVNSAAVDAASGIYLDDLNLENMDPEVAALYFPNFGKDVSYDRDEGKFLLSKDFSYFFNQQLRDSSKREQDEDVESGKGSSLPQSPAPGSSPKGSNLSVYMEDEKKKSGKDFVLESH